MSNVVQFSQTASGADSIEFARTYMCPVCRWPIRVTERSVVDETSFAIEVGIEHDAAGGLDGCADVVAAMVEAQRVMAQTTITDQLAWLTRG